MFRRSPGRHSGAMADSEWLGQRVEATARLVVSWISVAILSSCSNDAAGPSVAAPLQLQVTTSGAAFDADGYTLSSEGELVLDFVELSESRTIYRHALAGFTGTVEFELSGVADNCSVDGGPVAEVAYDAEAGGTVAFDVTCAMPSDLAALDLAFIREGDVFVTSLEEWTPERLTDGGDHGYLEATADGTRLVYSDATGIHVMALDGSGRETLASRPIYGLAGFSLSPDGLRLAYAEGDGWFSGEVHVRTLASGDDVHLPTPGIDVAPRWSPDGSRIAFERSEDGGGWSVYTVDPDGTVPVGILASGTSPVWSPTSAYLASSDHKGGLVVVPSSGGSALMLAARQDLDLRPQDWSGNGDWIVLDGWRDLQSDIYMMRVLDRGLFRMTRDGMSRAGQFVSAG